MPSGNSQPDAFRKYPGLAEEQRQHPSAQPTSQPTPVFHVRHDHHFGASPYSRHQLGYMPFVPSQSTHPHQRPSYLPGVPMPYWTPPIPHHQYQMASHGPYKDNYDHPSYSGNRTSSQRTLYASSARATTPLSSMPQNNVSDTTWPDLGETNKTPTKASLRAQHRSRSGSEERPVRESLSSKENDDQKVLSIRKEAVARITTARQEDPSTARTILPKNSDSERFNLPLGSRQMVLQPSTSDIQPKSQIAAETDIAFSPSLSLSRTSTISASLEGSPIPSLRSLQSFGTGVWGYDDIPMLRSRLSETTQRRSKEKPTRQEQAGRLSSSLDFGLHDDLPYTPLMDRMDLFASPLHGHNSPASGLE